MSQLKYRFYPSILDAFQRVLDSREEFEGFFNKDEEGGYKRSYEEVLADNEQKLLDSINRVPHAPIEAADKGTAFNEIVDCLVHHRKCSNPALTLTPMETEGGTRFVRAEINGFTFDFDLFFCDAASAYFTGCTSQYLTKATLPTEYGDVELYGYIDELRSDVVYDIKTTKDYEFGKFANHWQHHLYPFCLITSGAVTEVKEFEYTVYRLSGGTSRTPLITGQQFRERYDFDLETSKNKLTEICQEFIEWLEAHRDKIYNHRIFCEPEPTPYYLFFDTETTGLPKSFEAPYRDTDNWPRLVQLGWIMTDEDGRLCKIGNRIIKPNGYTIPEEVVNIHGITTEMAMEKGEDLVKVLQEFSIDLSACKRLVGHNILFDKKIVGCEMVRINADPSLIGSLLIDRACDDTMIRSADYCKIPKGESGHGGEYKYPRLKQLHQFLFGYEFEDAHNALADVSATMKCFFELKRLGVIEDGTEF